MSLPMDEWDQRLGGDSDPEDGEDEPIGVRPAAPSLQATTSAGPEGYPSTVSAMPSTNNTPARNMETAGSDPRSRFKTHPQHSMIPDYSPGIHIQSPTQPPTQSPTLRQQSTQPNSQNEGNGNRVARRRGSQSRPSANLTEVLEEALRLEDEAPIRGLARQLSKFDGRSNASSKRPGVGHKATESIGGGLRGLIPGSLHHRKNTRQDAVAPSSGPLLPTVSTSAEGAAPAGTRISLEPLQMAGPAPPDMSSPPPLTGLKRRVSLVSQNLEEPPEEIEQELMIGEIKTIELSEEIKIVRRAMIVIALVYVVILVLRSSVGRLSEHVNVLEIVMFVSILLLSFPVLRFTARMFAYFITTTSPGVLYKGNRVYFLVALHYDIAVLAWSILITYTWRELFHELVVDEDPRAARTVFRYGYKLFQCHIYLHLGLLVKDFLVLLVATSYLWRPYLRRVQSSILAQYILLLLTDYCSKGYCDPEDQKFALEMSKRGFENRKNISLYAVSKAMGFIPRNKLGHAFFKKLGGSDTLDSSKHASLLGDYLFTKLLEKAKQGIFSDSPDSAVRRRGPLRLLSASGPFGNSTIGRARASSENYLHIPNVFYSSSSNPMGESWRGGSGQASNKGEKGAKRSASDGADAMGEAKAPFSPEPREQGWNASSLFRLFGDNDKDDEKDKDGTAKGISANVGVGGEAEGGEQGQPQNVEKVNGEAGGDAGDGSGMSSEEQEEESLLAKELCPALDPELLKAALKIFDLDNSGTITREEMVAGVVTTFKDHRGLAMTLQDSEYIARKLGILMTSVVLFVLFFVWLSVWDADVLSLSVTFASFLIAFSFMIGTAASEFLSSVIFIFVMRCYDVGDRIHIYADPETGGARPTDVTVIKINLLYTVCKRWDEQVFYIPNHILASKTIVNIQRTAHQWHEFYIHRRRAHAKIQDLEEEGGKSQIRTRDSVVNKTNNYLLGVDGKNTFADLCSQSTQGAIASSTPSSKINALKSHLQTFAKGKDRPEGIYPRIGFALTQLEDSTRLSIRIIFRQRGNWQDMEKKWACQSMCTGAIKKACDEVGISYFQPDLPVLLKEKLS